MTNASSIPTLELALLGWSPLDYWLLLACGLLLIGSAFFSGSETALFGMSQAQRRALHQQSPRTARIVDALLDNQRMLLITVMIGNMTINALYFVISSVLMMDSDAHATGQLLMAVVFLLVIVLLGEVLPKMFATSHRFLFVGLTSAPLFALHTLIKPLRIVVNTGVITPLSRLTAPTNRPPELSEDELHSLLDISGEAGVIDEHEQEMLRDVLEISRYKVRDVMTPRVRMLAIPDSATADDVRAALREKRLTKLPVYANDLDNIVGVLHVKRFLLDHARRPVRLRDYLSPPRYVPVMATLEQLLLHFQKTFSQSAIVVDEFGGTAGIVSVEDVVEELVGDITRGDTMEVRAPQMIGPRTWDVDGDVSIHDWAEAFGATVSSVPVATLGGLITHELGRVAVPDDVITIGNV
ncbi:MAG: HlyC/CorC family transporter, partial [Phycisphaerales bacterium]|nr:HlyC/CorC family transporter [Phycisphaerales bacterium]